MDRANSLSKRINWGEDIERNNENQVILNQGP